MIYETRQDVEKVGKLGARVMVEGDQIYARQLYSFWLAVDSADRGFTPHAINDGYWEAWITSWMSRQVRAGMHTIDVGANHGYYAFMMQAAGAQCMAIEPQRSLYDLMYKSSKKNPHIKNYVELVHAAASDVNDETISLYVPDGHGMNASISESYTPPAPDGKHIEEVSTVTLDGMVSAFSQIDFIKIDVEGAEEKVWDGMQKLWKRCRPVTLLEYRWDRYDDPERFAQKLFSQANVTYVDYDASEKPVDGVEHLKTQQNEDWMLVLR